MPKERKKAEGSGVDLLTFFESAPTAGVHRKEASPAEQAPLPQMSSLTMEDELKHLLESKGGKVTKTEIYSWAKRKNVPPAALYSAILRMLNEGKLSRRFDDSCKDLVYELL